MKEIEVKATIRKLITQALNSMGYEDMEFQVEHPAEDKFGDWSSNAAMILAKKEGKNPKEIAERIINVIDNKEIIEKVEIAGVGFINFYLKKEFLVKQAEKVNYEIEYKNYLSGYNRGKTMVIDYSAPNIAKPFGIGHLRSTNIGQAVYNIYKILGWKTIGDNHLGDWGTQFGKLIVAIKKWSVKPIDQLTIEDLEKLYVKFHQEAEGDESLVTEGRDWFAKLEKGDPKARKMWQTLIDISLKEFKRVYEILGVNIDNAFGESFYEDKMPSVLRQLKEKGLIKKSQGAEIVEFKDMPPAMTVKSDGTSTYFTRDMATVKYRYDTWKPDLSVYEVGADHILHFRQVFEVAKIMGWEPKEGFVHIAHGMFRWKDGKFSTRKGDTIHLADVIDKAKEKAKQLANNSQINKDLSASEKEEMIGAVAIGAIKFNDLSQDPKKDIIFDWEKVMSLEGDSGPYLQYTYARCQSVLKKSKIKEQKNITEIPTKINDDEMRLLRQITKFDEKIIESAERFSPSVLAEYLLELARNYNEFYGKYRIIGQPEETWRIFLTKSTSSTIHLGLELLGIKTIEKM